MKCRINPKPDGNCQFASLSDQLLITLNISVSHADLRLAVVNYLQNDSSFSQYVAGPWSLYLEKMARLGHFGDHITLKAVAAIYNVQIMVLSSLQRPNLISSAADSGFDPARPTMFVGHYAESKGEHYVSLEHPSDAAEFCSTHLASNATTNSNQAYVSLALELPSAIESEEHMIATPNVPANDFGQYIGSTKLSNKQKLDAIERRWHPKQCSDFPFSEHTKNGVKRRRSLNAGHLQRYTWLAVSKSGDKTGAWCAACVLFSVSDEHNGQRLGKLVTRPLIDFSDLTGKNGALDVHERSIFHASNAARAHEFLQRAKDATTHVDAQVNSQKKQQVLQNRQALASIVETIKLAALQNISLRGHRDDGRIEPDGLYPAENDGNFRMLLRFRVNSGDSVLQSHLRDAKGNALYTSKTTQNELLQVSADMVREKILQRVSTSPCWVFMADETTDRANREQLVMVVRYVDMHEGLYVIKEDPIKIIDLISDIRSVLEENCHDTDSIEVRMSGVNIANVLIKKLKDMPMEPTKMVAQCYDGAASMSSDRVGVAANIKNYAINAEYFHCANHGLNLATSQVTSVDIVRNAQSTMESVIVFLTDSAKREDLLRHVKINNDFDDNIKHKLVKLCQTRFVERHVAVERFWDQLPGIAMALELMQSWKDKKTSGKASTQLNSLLKTEFLVGVRILQFLAACLRPVSLALQEKGLDLTSALDKIDAVVTVLNDIRINVDTEFKLLFDQISNMAEQLHFNIETPRVPAVSRYRCSAARDQDAQTYYRVNVFIPALDAIMLDMKERFSMQHKAAFALAFLLPRNVISATWELVRPAFNKYVDVLRCKLPDISEEQAKVEFQVWAAMCRRMLPDDLEGSAISSVNKCPVGALPTVHTLLTILATLPVCTAEAERTFSKVERTLTALRSTMSEDRLDALILLQAHRDLWPSTDEIINQYDIQGVDGRRKLDFKFD